MRVACVLLVVGACAAPTTTGLFAVPSGPPPADGDFYALPFPNDVYRKNGTLDLATFPTNGMIVDLYRKSAQELDGFGLNQAIYARFDRELDLEAGTPEIRRVHDALLRQQRIQLSPELGVASGEHACLAPGQIVWIILTSSMQIPTRDLDVSFRIAEKTLRRAGGALLGRRTAVFRGPVGKRTRRNLHHPDLAVASILPGTKVTLFVSDAPDQIRIDPIACRLARNHSIVAMNPIVIEKVKSRCDQQQNYEDDGQLLHRDNRVTRRVKGVKQSFGSFSSHVRTATRSWRSRCAVSEFQGNDRARWDRPWR